MPDIKIFSAHYDDECNEMMGLTKDFNPLWIEKSCYKRPIIYIDDVLIGNLNDLLKIKTGLKQRLFKYNASYKPFHYSWAVELRSLHENMHWTEKEISLADDVTDWKTGKLSEGEKRFVTQILRLFTQLDVSVGQLYHNAFIPVFKNNEVRNMLCSFACREGTHQQAYALLNDTLGLPESDYSAFLKYKQMTDKTKFMSDMNVDTIGDVAFSLVKAVYNEGVSLFAAFVMLLNFQRFGVMKGMGKVVEWSVRDENVHVEGLCKLFKTLISEYPFVLTENFYINVRGLQQEVLTLETAFIDLVFVEDTLRNLKRLDVVDYVKYVLQRRTAQLGLSNEINLKNPISWVSWLILGRDVTNFFENRVTEYNVSGLEGDW
ncbi:Ribonucleotide reductase [Lymphocystis disease virus 3]|uniref:ribonucleoside-diphosphate reductase n=1 Tax=Lymphocystis disease virus 3 TaxID=2560566 RepID=A0A1B2RVX7_9VIRU|nr:Ribonucleotide reductase [Lymphocystis disease virus Sa]AOC55148.1 Ribonucleotide reductase [Lymphocystis disease virus 3]